MIEFTALAAMFFWISKEYNDRIDGERGDKIVAVLSIVFGLGGTALFVLALLSAPWGDVL